MAKEYVKHDEEFKKKIIICTEVLINDFFIFFYIK